jgi:hypothetical protein
MKHKNFPKFSAVILVALSVVIGPLASNAQTSPAPVPPQNPTAVAKLSGPAREVVKMVSSGVPEEVLKAYVESSQSAFNLSVDNIINMQGVGVSPAVMTDMLTHDKNLRDNASAYAAMQPPTQTMAPSQYPTAPETVDNGYAADDSDYYGALAPYGNWNYQAGYGWCWQPYVGLGINAYPWGILGYGGWCNFPGRGWCWFPNSRFHGFNCAGTFAGNRFSGRGGVGFNGRFNGGFHETAGAGFNRGFAVNRSASVSHRFSPAMGHFSSGGFSGGHFSGGGHSSFGGGHSFGGGGARGGGGAHGGGGGGHR